MDTDHTAIWFLETWRAYVKQKYRAALNRWDTETGNGAHDSHAFGNFCGDNIWCLTWVYMMDIPTNHILWCSAKGKPPSSVGRESGFENSSIQSPLTASSSPASKRKAVAVTSLLEEQKKGSTALSAVAKRLTAVLDARAKMPPKPASEVLLDEFCKNQQQHGLITSMTTSNFMTQVILQP